MNINDMTNVILEKNSLMDVFRKEMRLAYGKDWEVGFDFRDFLYDLICQNGRIRAIRLLRTLFDLSLKETVDFIKSDYYLDSGYEVYSRGYRANNVTESVLQAAQEKAEAERDPEDLPLTRPEQSESLGELLKRQLAEDDGMPNLVTSFAEMFDEDEDDDEDECLCPICQGGYDE